MMTGVHSLIMHLNFSFDGTKKRVGSKEKQERDKLQHKLKREMKGAIREIRRDNAFIARQKLQEQIERYLNSFCLHFARQFTRDIFAF